MKFYIFALFNSAFSGLADFNSQISCYFGGMMSSQYIGYGCYCGRFNAGFPVDATDQCCFEHDHCYDKTDATFSSGLFLESVPKSYFKMYNYICKNEEVICEDEADSYSRALCECDKTAATCFKKQRHTYNKYFTKKGEFDKERFCYEPVENRQRIETENFKGCERESAHQFCCDKEAYDNRFNLCCDGEILSDIFYGCCFGKSFLKITHYCELTSFSEGTVKSIL
ncbi:unnamed protein product [Oikopleura dioica]|uniref:Phospholipase A2 n=1 Tax=Oikopleura dioica TaxID=34765 RepID=E4YML2_OIKDI|nr:unnamed protein product [Oikopleura dioica]